MVSSNKLKVDIWRYLLLFIEFKNPTKIHLKTLNTRVKFISFVLKLIVVVSPDHHPFLLTITERGAPWRGNKTTEATDSA